MQAPSDHSSRCSRGYRLKLLERSRRAGPPVLMKGRPPCHAGQLLTDPRSPYVGPTNRHDAQPQHPWRTRPETVLRVVVCMCQVSTVAFWRDNNHAHRGDVGAYRAICLKTRLKAFLMSVTSNRAEWSLRMWNSKAESSCRVLAWQRRQPLQAAFGWGVVWCRLGSKALINRSMAGFCCFRSLSWVLV